MKRVFAHFSGDGLKARALRVSGLSVFSLGAHSLMRLGSNLILTRMLAPEAFGIIAIAYVVTTAIEMFSDIGLRPSVIQHARGDEPDFLNTVWTLQIARGALLWAVAAGLGPVMAGVYNEPLLIYVLPVIGFEAMLAGLRSTKIYTQSRHMKAGRITVLGLISRAIGIVTSIIMTYVLQNFWGVIIGSLVSYVTLTILSYTSLPGIMNRLHWENKAARDIMGFGSFVFLSTLSSFLLSQGDKAILGRLMSLELLGIYNIGVLLGTLPLMLVNNLVSQLLMPIYREKPPSGGADNRRALRKMRLVLFGGVQAAVLIFAYGGIWLVELLYNDDYALAGPVVSLFALSLIPRLIGLDYNGALLSAGDSRALFFVQLFGSILYTIGIYAGFQLAGLFGAILAQGVAAMLAYPLRAKMAHKHQAWDWKIDLLAFVVPTVVALGAVWLHWDTYMQLLGGALQQP